MDKTYVGLMALAIGVCAIGSGIGIFGIASGAMNAMGRQPEAIGKIQIAMIIALAFAEALTIYALVFGFAKG